MSEPIGLFYIDGDALDGFVQAGDSAERTVRAVMKQLTPDRRRSFLRWLEVANKVAKQVSMDTDIALYRAGVIAEAKKNEGGVYAVREPKAPEKSKATVEDLMKDFGF